jgi:protein-disulfide isomerase
MEDKKENVEKPEVSSQPSVESTPTPAPVHTPAPAHPSSAPSKSDEGATFTMKKSTMWKLATFVFAGLFLITLFNGGLNFGSGTGNVVGGGDNPSPTVPTQPSNIRVSIGDDDPVLGNADAPISIIEFSDFQCPFCARAYTGAVTEFKNSDYFKDGEVNLVYKHFPLNSIHPQAQKAAEASACAQDQGKFWEYHDLLFINQQSLSNADLKSYAGQLSLDQGTFDSCLDSGDKADKVNSDLAEASAAGGRGTPYFVIVNSDGETQAVSGAVPFANFEAAISSLQ